MSKTAIALIVKFLYTFVFGWLTLSLIDNNSTRWVAMVALVATGLNYMFGDLVVLSRFGNILASLTNGLMAVMLAYIFRTFTAHANKTTLGTLVIFALLIAIGEYFFHKYLLASKEVSP